MFLLWPSNCPDVGIGPLLEFPHLLTPDFPPSSSSYGVQPGSIYSFLVVRYSVRSQQVFCKHFCVGKCIPDVSMGRDVLHVHLLLHHLVPPSCHLVINFWSKKDNTYCCSKMVNNSNGNASVTRSTADWYCQSITDKGLILPLSTNVHKVLAMITANL